MVRLVRRRCQQLASTLAVLAIALMLVGPPPIASATQAEPGFLTDEDVILAVSYAFSVDPVAFDTRLVAQKAPGDYIWATEVVDRSAPRPDIISTVRWGRRSGTEYRFRVRMVFDTGFEHVYPVRLFQAADTEMWLVSVNNRGFIELTA